MIMSKATSEVLERWNFSIETDSEVVEKGYFSHQMILSGFVTKQNRMLNFFTLFSFSSWVSISGFPGRRVTRKS